MTLVIICTLSLIFIFFFASKYKQSIEGVSYGFDADWKYHISQYAYVLFAIVLIFTSAVRHGYVDTYAYKEMYINARNDLDYVNSAPWGVESGWLYFCYLLNYISSSPNFLLLVSAFIIVYSYVHIIKKYSCDPVFSMIIFFCIEYMDTNNGLRQMVASSLCLLAFMQILKHRIWNYAGFAILLYFAYQFHVSSIVCLIITVLAIGKPLNLRIISVLLLGLLFVFFPQLVNSWIEYAFADSKYLHYLDNSFGMSFLRALIVGIIPAVLAFVYIIFSKKRGVIITPQEAFFLNVVFINTLFTIMGLNMQYWARMGFYTAYAPFVLMPKLIYSVFHKKQRTLIKSIAILCYFVFFAYNVYVNIAYGAIGDFYYDVIWSGV